MNLKKRKFGLPFIKKASLSEDDTAEEEEVDGVDAGAVDSKPPAKSDGKEDEDIAKVASDSVQPDVVMLTSRDDGYHLKMASSRLFAPQETVADRFHMTELVGADMVKEADSSGVSLISTDPVVKNIAEDDKAEIIERFGEYRVKSLDGKELLGWVFPKVLDFDGTQLPMTLFSNGSAASMQSQIAGSFVGAGTNVIRGKLEGNGFFYRVTSEGSVLAFVPGKILHPFADDEGAGVLFESVLGERSRVRHVPGMKSIAKIGSDEYAIPGDVHWLPFDGSALVKVMDTVDLFSKVASAKQASKMVTIVSDGRTWTFNGRCGLDKLANEDRQSLDGADALFLGCALGMDELTSARALAIAGQRGKVKIAGCRTLTSPYERMEESMERSKQMWEALPPRYNLFKEASTLEDATTVDKVLSIGFLNPENVATFVGYLPEIERTVSKLAELLVAIRLGLRSVPEIAVKNAMERLDEVSAALKALMYQASES